MNLERKIQELLETESLGVLADFRKLQERADEIVRVLKQNKLPVDQKLHQITYVGRDAGVFTESPKQDAVVEQKPKTEKVVVLKKLEFGEKSKLKLAAEKRSEQARLKTVDLSIHLLNYLENNGPTTSMDLTRYRAGSTRYAVGKALALLKVQGKVGHRTDGFQGSTLWYSFTAPITQTQLSEYLETVKSGAQVTADDILQYFKLDQRSHAGVNLALRATARTGGLVKRGGLFIKEKGVLPKPSNGSDRKATFSGSGLATSGDKVSSNKEVLALVARAQNQGAEIEAGGKHIKIRYKGKTTTIGRTPSASGLKSDWSNLRAMGLNV